ncbi:MAG: hypothetical protein K0S23_1331 [Fluviicola sp.]|jgi:hypothetical protein|uniref:hypothetical protein n=1 Tax=Fluviicola sp. TaxID=1917219 RepID=UPI002609BE84|nr:hypothetical protein [Fluviicola sp.]MDF3027024.1 hypothetical protein [Fluviicola sp.]
MKYILPYIILVLVGFSCKKSKHPCEGKYTHSYTTISSSFDSYLFKENSYWVYRNDSTTEIDSQRVVSTINTQIGSGGGSSCGSAYAEKYQMQIECSFNNQHFNYNIIGSSLYKQTFVPGNYEAYIFSNAESFTSGNGVQLLETIPSMNLNGNSIQHIKKVRVDLPAYDIIYYFANGVGVIKWEVLQGTSILESWSIKSWEVVL